MSDEQKAQAIDYLVLAKLINRLVVDYKNQRLSDGQLYSLYQQCSVREDFKEMINDGSAEPLP